MVKKSEFEFTDNFRFLQKAVIFHPTEKKILTIKRSPTDFSRANTWDIPGGHVTYGESHEDSLRREIREETGMEVGSLAPFHVISEYDKAQPMYYLWIVYQTAASTDQITLSHEHTDFRWVTPEAFLKLKSADFLQEIVRKIKK